MWLKKKTIAGWPLIYVGQIQFNAHVSSFNHTKSPWMMNLPVPRRLHAFWRWLLCGRRARNCSQGPTRWCWDYWVPGFLQPRRSPLFLGHPNKPSAREENCWEHQKTQRGPSWEYPILTLSKDGFWMFWRWLLRLLGRSGMVPKAVGRSIAPIDHGFLPHGWSRWNKMEMQVSTDGILFLTGLGAMSLFLSLSIYLFISLSLYLYISRYLSISLSLSILSYPILILILILSYPILSYPILSYPILSYPILSYPILSYPILSYPILSYPIYLSVSLSLSHIYIHTYTPMMIWIFQNICQSASDKIWMAIWVWFPLEIQPKYGWLHLVLGWPQDPKPCRCWTCWVLIVQFLGYLSVTHDPCRNLSGGFRDCSCALPEIWVNYNDLTATSL